jgi:acyl-CoA reductase-like NAD-dependent aldehyde dehydrogenase
MKARAGKKRVVLELGANSAAIVDVTADLARAAERCAYGAFKNAGQICISVQRILVHEHVWDDFLEAFTTRAQALKVGSALEQDTDVGPMIHEREADRIESWIDQAVAASATARTSAQPCSPTFRGTRRSRARRRSAPSPSSHASRTSRTRSTR